jgi:hypothetical protein
MAIFKRRIPSKLRDFRFVDRRRIDSYVDQLGGMDLIQYKRSRKSSLSIQGPVCERSREEVLSNPSDSDKIKFLSSELRRRDILALRRPAEDRWDRELPNFILEETLATPVTIPGGRLPVELHLAGFKVWISEPNPQYLNDEKWNFRGSFLYLAELLFDNKSYESTWSGCSALRFIANAASGKCLRDNSGREFLGRFDPRHPIEKLFDIGGVKGDARKIESLYTIRYMTDEQSYTYRGVIHRVHDILGYPLFISVL